MSSESDSDVFFDAEDITPVRTLKSKTKADVPVEKNNIEVESVNSEDGPQKCTSDDSSVIAVQEEDIKEAERKVKENEKRRKKVEELRNRMLKDEEEATELPSEESSIASSVENIYPSGSFTGTKTASNKDEEARSMMSLGKVGLILGEKASIQSCSSSRESDTLSADSRFSANEYNSYNNYGSSGMKCPEPDLVASTKCDRSVDKMPRPVAPPRKKRKNKNEKNETLSLVCNNAPEVSSPTDSVEGLAKELECSLDIRSATQGQYVVKPQDREQDRAEGPTTPHSSNSNLAEKVTEVSDPPTSLFSQKTSDSEGSLKIFSGEAIQPFIVRTRSDSGRPLTDQEILAQVTVRNLDTGEQIPLSQAEEHLPKCLNPLSLHIMRLTSEYVSTTALDKERESDEESIDSKRSDILDANRVWARTRGFGRFIGGNIERRFHQLKTVVADKVHHTRHADEEGSEEEVIADLRTAVKIKVSSKLKSLDKGMNELPEIQLVQEISGEHAGAVWTMKFSSCGRLLATAGQDHDLRIWVLKDTFKYFDDMRHKFNKEGKSSPTPSQDSASSATAASENNKFEEVEQNDEKGPFMEKPFWRYKGHTAELLDVSWSKNYFILSSSMDKTVRLWHISRPECLCCFQHIDFVTAIAFHPRDDRYFLSGSLDGKLRLWNIPDKKVTLWNELDGQTKLITAVNFCQNGKIAVVGSYDGRCIFYSTEQLKYYTQIHVRSTRGKNSHGRKISGIEAMPGEDKILVTSNDSRIRLYDLRDLSLSCKYKGYVNLSSQIKASFSHDGKHIISGSENQFIYLWKTYHDYTKSSRRDRNDYWIGIKAHNAVVTSAVFAPKPSLIVKQLETVQDGNNELNSLNCYVLVSADFSGIIKVFLHKTKATTVNCS